MVPTTSTPKLGLAVIGLVSTFAATLVVAAQVLGRLRLGGLGAVLAVAAVTASVAGWVVFRGHPRATATDLIAPARGLLLFVATVLLVLAGPLHRSTFAPVTNSVDAAHHAGIVAWIRDTGRIAVNIEPELGFQSKYPAGAHTIAAVTSFVARIPPHQAMWLVAVVWIVSLWFMCGAVAVAIGGEHARPFFVVPVILAMAGWRYSLGMVSADFFFAQLGGIWLATGTVVAIVGLRQAHRSVFFIGAIVTLGAIAVLFTYPQAAVLPIGAFVVELFTGTFTRKTVIALMVTLAVAFVGGFALAKIIGVDKRLIAGGSEGERPPFTLAAFGGVIVLIVVLAGTVEMVVGAVRRREGYGAVIGSAIGPAAAATGLALLRLPVLGNLDVSDYRIAKFVYGAIPFALVGATIAVANASRTVFDLARLARHDRLARLAPLANRRAVNAGIAGAVVLVAALAITAPAERSLLRRPIVSRNDYAASTWAHSNLDPSAVGIAVRGLDGYHLWWGALRRPAPQGKVLDGATRMIVWDTWPTQTDERYLITSGSMANRFREQDGVKEIYRSGDAVVLDRGK
jgi:hypothetical protein